MAFLQVPAAASSSRKPGTPRRQTCLQYSHGDEGFWDQLNKLQKKYLPALSALIENIELVIKEKGTTEQILTYRAKLGRLNSMLLNIYGIHKLNKKMEILDSLETQVAQWIKVWESYAKEVLEESKPKQTEITKDVETIEKSTEISEENDSMDDEKSKSDSSNESDSNESYSEDESSSDSSSSEDDTPVEITSLNLDQLGELVNKFQAFGLGPIENKNLTPTGKRNRDATDDRSLGKSLPVFNTDEFSTDARIAKRRLVSSRETSL